MAHTVGRAGGDKGVGDLPQPLRRRGAANQLCLDRSATCDGDVIFTLVCGCSSRYFVDEKFSILLSDRGLKLYINYDEQGCFLHSPPSEGLGEVPNQLWLDRTATCDGDVIFMIVCGCSSR